MSSSFFLNLVNQHKRQVTDSLYRLASCGVLATTAWVGLSEDRLVAADEAEHGLHSADYPWPHNGIFFFV